MVSCRCFLLCRAIRLAKVASLWDVPIKLIHECRSGMTFKLKWLVIFFWVPSGAKYPQRWEYTIHTRFQCHSPRHQTWERKSQISLVVRPGSTAGPGGKLDQFRRSDMTVGYLMHYSPYKPCNGPSISCGLVSIYVIVESQLMKLNCHVWFQACFMIESLSIYLRIYTICIYIYIYVNVKIICL